MKTAGLRRDLPAPVGALARNPGQTLGSSLRHAMAARFDHDLNAVRVHTDASAAQLAAAHGADALTMGHDVAFARGRYAPTSAAGRTLIAHELAHVVQQDRGRQASASAPGQAHEAEADQAARAVTHGGVMPTLSPASAGVQRQVSIRDVGRGEASGMGRMDEFIARLNQVSTGLDFRFEGGLLLAGVRAGGQLSEFDRQMQRFINGPADLRMRMTNHQGRSGPNRANMGPVSVDEWLTGYVDIDDLLGSSASDFMTMLVHLLRERQRTGNYTQRIGTPSLDARLPAPRAEFDGAHQAGLQAELLVLRDLIGDPSLHFVDFGTRLLTNDHGDRFIEVLNGQANGNNFGRWMVRPRGSASLITLEDFIARRRAEPAPAAR